MSLFARFRPLRPDRAELRSIVDQLPLAVRIAMLDGVRAERIIAGGYADGSGGVCPMLAAHRHGARWSFPDFARTWDEFAEAPIEGLRDADAAHVDALAAVLTASIEDDLLVDAVVPDAVDVATLVRGAGRDALDASSLPRNAERPGGTEAFEDPQERAPSGARRDQPSATSCRST